MASLDGFNANTVEPSKDFGLLPRSEQTAIIVESERKETQAGDGAYISLTFQICDGEFQNRKLWLNLNLWNKNDQTVQIAKGQLSSICRAVGIMEPKDTAELHNKPIKISIGQKKNKTSGNLENNITGFKPRNAGPPKQEQTPVGAGSAKAPW